MMRREFITLLGRHGACVAAIGQDRAKRGKCATNTDPRKPYVK
jgi:hypothetical protein